MSRTRRQIFTSDAKLKFTANATEGKIGTISGYALNWNALSTDRGGYNVRLLPNSAKFTNPCLALFHHNFSAVIGNTANKSLRLSSDEVGVRFEIDLPNTSVGRDVQELVDKGYVRGMSFAMTDAPDAYSSTEDGKTILNAKSFGVDEITVTAIPAFTSTSVQTVDDEDEEDQQDREELSQESLRLERLKFSTYAL